MRERWADGTELQLLEKAIVISVRADPEPGDLFVLEKPEGTISEGHANRVGRVAIVRLLELEARVPGVVAEQPIRRPEALIEQPLSIPFTVTRPNSAVHRAGFG
jgi:hypothetical protein